MGEMFNQFPIKNPYVAYIGRISIRFG